MNMKFNYPYKSRSDFLKDVVKLLIERRVELGITQEELNYRLGVADRLISKWECGVRTPTSFHLYCWADALESKLIISKDQISYKKKIANDN